MLVFSTFRDWNQRIVMRSRGCRDGLPHSPVVQIMLSSVKPRASSSTVIRVRISLTETSFYHLMYFKRHKSLCILFEINFNPFFMYWIYCVFLLLAFLKFLESNRRFTLKMGSDVRDYCMVPLHHEHRDTAACVLAVSTGRHQKRVLTLYQLNCLWTLQYI
jgi:hypothetical protein